MNKDEEFLLGHSVCPVDRKDVLSPLIELATEEKQTKRIFKRFLGASIPTAGASNITGGEPISTLAVSSIAGFSAAFGEEVLATFSNIAEYFRTPLKKLDFDVGNFVMLTGWKRDDRENLIEEYGKKPVSMDEKRPTDEEPMKKLLMSIGLAKNNYYYDKTGVRENPSEFSENNVINRDIISLSCIQILPFKELVGKDFFPCNFNLRENRDEFTCHSSEEKYFDRDENAFPKYGIKVEKEGEIYDPIWNEVDYALITITKGEYLSTGLSKSTLDIFGKKRFINLTGCHKFGTFEACNRFLDRDFIKEINDNMGRYGVQALLKTDIIISPDGRKTTNSRKYEEFPKYYPLD
jgi:hypothetical protein